MSSDNIIPENRQGIQTNTESSIEFSTEKEAKHFFEVVKNRLVDINRWHKLAGKTSASFRLTDHEGKPVSRTAQKNDHIKIDIPGPGTDTGGGKDWVQIEDIEEKENLIGILVRPASNPNDERKDVAHFFDEQSTSSFVVRKEKYKIIAGVYGRNEKPNTETETTIDRIRNVAVATVAITGFSKIQWKSLVNGLLAKE